MTTTATPSSPMASPSKRLYTDDVHVALYSARHTNTYASSLIPDDLTARLQNVGTRVRKCVNEGYKTQLHGLPSSIPLAPFNSPIKPLTFASNTYACSPSASPLRSMPAPQIFKTANEAIIEALNSPSRVGSSAAPHHDVQRKRGRDECDEEPSNDDAIRRQLFKLPEPVLDADGDVGMDEVKEEDEEDVEFFLGHNNGLPNRQIRPIKPLRKGSPEMFVPPSQATQERDSAQASHNGSNGDLNFMSPVLSSAVSDITAHMRMVVEGSRSETCSLPSLTPDMFEQPF